MCKWWQYILVHKRWRKSKVRENEREEKLSENCQNTHRVIVEESVKRVSRSIALRKLGKNETFPRSIKLVNALGQPVNLLRNHGFDFRFLQPTKKKRTRRSPKDPVSNSVNV